MVSQTRTVTHPPYHPFQAPPTPFKPLLPIPTLPTTPTSRHHQSNILQGEGCHCPRLLHTHHPVTQTINGHDTSACRGRARSNGSTVRGGRGEKEEGGCYNSTHTAHPSPYLLNETVRASGLPAQGHMASFLSPLGTKASMKASEVARDPVEDRGAQRATWSSLERLAGHVT